MPPVERSLEKSSEKLFANGFAALPSASMWLSSGWVPTSAVPIFFEAFPKLWKYCVVLFEKGAMFSNVLLMPGAATPRSLKVGIDCSANASSRLR